MNLSILDDNIQEFIRSEKGRSLLCSGVFASPFDKVSPQELSTQIKGFWKALEKLPHLCALHGIIYPAGISMEQCSGEAAAGYKASLVPPGILCADITGGLGSDTMALARRFDQVDYFELNGELAELAAHNFPIAGADNVRVHAGDGLAGVLNDARQYDLIYADPARRDANASRVFSIGDCTPDISAVKDELLDKSPRLLVKLSPMLDITAVLRLFPETSQVHAVAVKNEVKELLFLLEKGFSGCPAIFAADLQPDGRSEVFSAPADGEAPVTISQMGQYVYDLSAALRKAGLADTYAASLGLKKLHPRTSLYTSDQLFPDIRGRAFHVEGPVEGKNVKKSIPGLKAGVISRNYPATAGDIRKKYGLKEDEECFLLALRTMDEKNCLIVARKIVL